MSRTVMRGKIKRVPSSTPQQSTEEQQERKIGIPWDKALSRFILSREALGIGDRTILDYRKTVALFFKRFPDAFENEEKLTSCIYKHMSQKVKPATYNLRLIYLKTFFKWCIEQKIIEKNPLSSFKRKREDSRIVDISPQDLGRLIQAFDQNTYTGLRDYALYILQINTGIRPGEALQQY